MAAEKISGIYEIVNTVNGKRYIGSSVNIKTRWSQHRVRLSSGDHHCPPLQRAWVKYGSDAFEFRVIERCGRDVLVSLEQSYLDLHLLGFTSQGILKVSENIPDAFTRYTLLSVTTRNTFFICLPPRRAHPLPGQRIS